MITLDSKDGKNPTQKSLITTAVVAVAAATAGKCCLEPWFDFRNSVVDLNLNEVTDHKISFFFFDTPHLALACPLALTEQHLDAEYGK